MRKLFATLILSLTLSGCIMTQYNGLHDIINENLVTYEKYEEIRFENIAAIFKEYSNLANAKEYKLHEIKTETKKFIKRIETEPISPNYPVQASPREAYVARSFLNDLVKAIERNDVSSNRINGYINQALKIYITEIINHEEKVPK